MQDEAIDIVLIEDDQEKERVTVRGDVGFTRITPLSSLREIITQELRVPQRDQIIFVDDAEIDFSTDPEVVLSDVAIRNGSTLFVVQADRSYDAEVPVTPPNMQHVHSKHDMSEGVSIPVSQRAARLVHALSEMESLRLDAAATEIERRWEQLVERCR